MWAAAAQGPLPAGQGPSVPVAVGFLSVSSQAGQMQTRFGFPSPRGPTGPWEPARGGKELAARCPGENQRRGYDPKGLTLLCCHHLVRGAKGPLRSWGALLLGREEHPPC